MQFNPLGFTLGMLLAFLGYKAWEEQKELRRKKHNGRNAEQTNDA